MALRGSNLRVAPRRRPLSSRAPTRRAARLQLLVAERPAPPGPFCPRAPPRRPLPPDASLPLISPLLPSSPTPSSSPLPPLSRFSHGAGGCSAPRAAQSRSNNPGAAGGVTAGKRPSRGRHRVLGAHLHAAQLWTIPRPRHLSELLRMRTCGLPTGTLRGRRATRGPRCAALWLLLLAQVGVQVNPSQWGQGPPRLPSRSPPPHRGVPAVFHQAPACALGPAAASPGSSSVWRPPGPAEQLGGKSASRVLILAA